MKINLFQQKGKAPTKGAKQILLENSVTLNFYRNMSLVAIAAYGVVTTCLYLEDLTTGVIVSCIKTTTKPTYLVVFTFIIRIMLQGCNHMFYTVAISFQVMNVLVLLIYGGCYQMMKYISRPTYTGNNGQLLDPGLDLNMEGGMGE